MSPRRFAFLLALLLTPMLGRAASFAFTTAPAPIKKTYGSEPFQFGYLAVPEDHAKPLGKSIQIAVVILKSRNASSALPPVFFLTGGPGGSATEDAVYFDVFPALQKQHDVVLIDQRGTGFSSPFLGITSGTYAAAKTGFTNQGIDLSLYNTTQNAADIADLRTALGYGKVIIFGNSYGTFLAQEVMRSHPDGIAAVVIDGVLPAPDTFIPDFNKNELHGLNALFKDVQKTGPARRAFPQFSRTYFKLLTRLKHGKITFPSGFQITLDDFQGTIEALMQSSDRISRIPLLVTEIAARHESAWLRKNFQFGDGGARGFSDGMYLSTLATDWNQPNWFSLTRKSNGQLRPAIFREANALSSLSVVYTVMNYWTLPYNPLATRTPLVSSIPTLLLAGEMESQTPPDGATLVAKGLSTNFNLFFPRSGHITGFIAGPPLSALVQFVNDPGKRPVYSLASLKRNNFYLTKVPVEAQSRAPERPMKFMP